MSKENKVNNKSEAPAEVKQASDYAFILSPSDVASVSKADEEEALKRAQRVSIVDAMCLYWFNTPPMEIIKAVYDSEHEEYLQEKLEVYRRGLPAFWGGLDLQHRERMVALADAKYGTEAVIKYCNEVLARSYNTEEEKV